VKTIAHEERITIGKILKPRGVRGEVKVLSLTDIPDRFEHLRAVTVELAQGQDLDLEIEGVSYYKGFVFLRFVGYFSREAAQQLVGGLLQVKRSSVPKLPEGSFYHFEILDSRVYTDTGQYLGMVTDILETGTHDVYVVQGHGREYLIPSNKEIVRQINREQRTIVIHPLDGLLDLS